MFRRLTSLAMLCAFVLVAPKMFGEWTPAKIEKLHQAIVAKVPDWTRQKTAQLIEDSKGSVQNSKAIIVQKDNTVVQVNVLVMGDSALVDGKDVTGDLGNKITTGSNSPIIGEIGSNAQVVIGDKNSISQSGNVDVKVWLSAAGCAAIVMAFLGLRRRQATRRGSSKK